MAYSRSGKLKEAYEALRTATTLDPMNENHYMDLIILCLEASDHALALQIADAGLQRMPTSHRLHLQRGAVLAMKGEFGEAEKEFTEANRLSPDAGLSNVAMGLVLIQMEKVSEAIEVLRRQRSKTPNDPYVFWFLGEALNRSGIKPGSDVEKEAIAALETSIRLNSALSQPRALLGKILLRRGELERACEQLEKAVELDPEDLTATYQLAQALQRKGDSGRAKELFLKVEKARIAERDLTERNLLRILKEGKR
jgi:Flp pilus assembly protein TadD